MSTISEGADYRLTVHDKQGVMLDELNASVDVLWAVTDIGKLFFTMSTNDAKCTYTNLNFGNYVLFQHAELGNWGGVICPHDQRKWNGLKQVTIPCLAAEYQFNRARIGTGDVMKGTAGDIFLSACQEANKNQDMLIRTAKSSIWHAGVDGSFHEGRFGILSDMLKDVVKRTGVDWWLDAQIDATSGRLVFNAYLAQKRGATNSYVLKEGFNIETPDGDFYIEEGDIINDALARGTLATSAVAPTLNAKDQPSIDVYGLWMSADKISAAKPGPIQNFANNKVAQNSQPQQKFLLTAIESVESSDTFAHIGLGDVCIVDLNTVGFYYGGNGVTANARIMSREYNTEQNKVVLVTQVVNG
jgi:hypothetical protein